MNLKDILNNAQSKQELLKSLKSAYAYLSDNIDNYARTSTNSKIMYEISMLIKKQSFVNVNKDRLELFIGLLSDNFKEFEKKGAIPFSEFVKVQNLKMFYDTPHFKEIHDDPDYFKREKYGLKASVVEIHPEDYMQAVEKKHKTHSVSAEKVASIVKGVKDGNEFLMPYLIYGSRDENESYFAQEGYNRAYVANELGIKRIPVSIRYREDDNKNDIPEAIKIAIKWRDEELKHIPIEDKNDEIIETEVIQEYSYSELLGVLESHQSHIAEKNINSNLIENVLKHELENTKQEQEIDSPDKKQEQEIEEDIAPKPNM